MFFLPRDIARKKKAGKLTEFICMDSRSRLCLITFRVIWVALFRRSFNWISNLLSRSHGFFFHKRFRNLDFFSGWGSLKKFKMRLQNFFFFFFHCFQRALLILSFFRFVWRAKSRAIFFVLRRVLFFNPGETSFRSTIEKILIKIGLFWKLSLFNRSKEKHRHNNRVRISAYE